MHDHHAPASQPAGEDDSEEWKVGRVYPVVPGQLYFTSHSTNAQTRKAIAGLPELFFFSSFEPESYLGYCRDFGPTGLAGVVSFCRSLGTLLQDPRLRGRPVVYYAEADTGTLSNAAFLLGAYLVLIEGMSPEDAAAPFSRIQPSPFKAFRDATHLESDFDLSVLDCLCGLARGTHAGFFDLETFDLEQFTSDDALGLSVMCPKFVAFKGPASGSDRPPYTIEPEAYLDRFQELGVSDVVRLNDASKYDRQLFIEAGMRHHDIEFSDCTPPPMSVVRQFLDVCSGPEGIIAVHCIAGLGRTGTLIALHLIVNHGWSAREAIGWLRIVRPGSVIGVQQHFLVSVEACLRRNNTLDEPSSQEGPARPAAGLFQAFPEVGLAEREAEIAAVRALQVADGLAQRVAGAKTFYRTL